MQDIKLNIKPCYDIYTHVNKGVTKFIFDYVQMKINVKKHVSFDRFCNPVELYAYKLKDESIAYVIEQANEFIQRNDYNAHVHFNCLEKDDVIIPETLWTKEEIDQVLNQFK